MTGGDGAPYDLAVVGAGPAGLAAAVTALQSGLRVVLLDRAPSLGGQYWRQPAPSSGEHSLSGRELSDLQHGLGTYARLAERVREGQAAGRLTLLLRTPVWTALRGAGTVTLSTAGPPVGGSPAAQGARVGQVAGQVVARRVVIATGAHDVALPFPGWQLPGVMTVGGLQALLKGSGVAPGRRVVVAGSGPFLLPVALGLARRGVTVVGVHEASSPWRWAGHLLAVARNLDRVGEGLGYAAALVHHRVPVHTRSLLVQAHGAGQVEAVTVQRVGADGLLVPGSRREVEADTVGVGWGFAPVVDLAVALGCAVHRGADGRLAVTSDASQRTSVPEVLVAGETSGVAGAAVAVLEGELAALAVVDDLRALADASGGAAHDLTTATDDRAATSAASASTTPVARARRVGLARRQRAGEAFATALSDAHPVTPAWVEALTPDTVLCRCEEVPVSAVTALVAQGVTDVRQVRQLTRVGMGWCQGRTCETACTLLVARTAQQLPGRGETTGGVAGARDADGLTPAVTAVTAVPVDPAIERLVAQPVRLGVLAARVDGVTGASGEDVPPVDGPRGTRPASPAEGEQRGDV